MKKEIYITALHLAHGGVEMAISLMSNAFIKKGYSVTILSLYHLGAPAYPISPQVKIEYLTDVKPNKKEFKEAIKSKNPFRILKEGFYAVKVLRLKKTALVKRIKEIREGIIISTRNEHSVLLSKFGRDGVLKIAQLHHDHGFEQKLLADIKKRYGRIDTFTLLTDQLTTEVQKLLEGTGSRTRCITMENFLEECEFPIDFEKKEKTVVAVGRLHPVKGFDRLLEIWKGSSKDHPDWKLVIIGDGDEKQKLFGLADSLGIRDSVVFTGALPHDKVMEVMQRSSLYAMTSYSEGFGFVLIEAMACGLPPVAFDVRVGPRAIIQDGLNGKLIEDDATASYVKALNELMDREDLRLEFSRNAVLRAKDFSEETVMQKWIAVLEQKV